MIWVGNQYWSLAGKLTERCCAIQWDIRRLGQNEGNSHSRNVLVAGTQRILGDYAHKRATSPRHNDYQYDQGSCPPQ
ncbi:hypothetical protein F441_21448 [Phytophthora nicotianae CJ01A1]|uniref:Uncharacterized protein n=3 Tax=Phytophthora nicotianae TaxID=4792 RepID=V9DXT9_PHYNI|nr:hypothetical protein F443_21569 [Phytophthora nicotianae P1569]ETP01291.1 hypothetical protein F441_21448 [Phytophthora nicotianae CJ01A1]ETP29439.1 hypothetical protein F442_21406 [Phytophthora nicotianae P10297]